MHHVFFKSFCIAALCLMPLMAQAQTALPPTQSIFVPYLNKTIHVQSPYQWRAASTKKGRASISMKSGAAVISVREMAKASTCPKMLAVIEKTSKVSLGRSPLPIPQQWNPNVVVTTIQNGKYRHLQGCWLYKGVPHLVQIVSKDASFGIVRPAITALDNAMAASSPAATQSLFVPYLNKTIRVQSPHQWSATSVKPDEVSIRMKSGDLISVNKVAKALTCSKVLKALKKSTNTVPSRSSLPMPRQWNPNVIIKTVLNGQGTHLTGCWLYRGVPHIVQILSRDASFGIMRPVITALDNAMAASSSSAPSQSIVMPYLNKTVYVQSPHHWSAKSDKPGKVSISTNSYSTLLEITKMPDRGTCSAVLRAIEKKENVASGRSSLPMPKQWNPNVVVKTLLNGKATYLQGCWLYKGFPHYVQIVSKDASFGVVRPVITALDKAMSSSRPATQTRTPRPSPQRQASSKELESDLLSELQGTAPPKASNSTPKSRRAPRRTSTVNQTRRQSSIDWGDDINRGDIGVRIGFTQTAFKDPDPVGLLDLGFTMDFLSGAEDGAGIVTGLLLNAGATDQLSFYADVAYRIGLGLNTELVQFVLTGQAGIDWIGESDLDTFALGASIYGGPHAELLFWVGDEVGLRLSGGLFWRWGDSPQVMRLEASFIFGEDEEALTVGGFYHGYEDLARTIGFSLSMPMEL